MSTSHVGLRINPDKLARVTIVHEDEDLLIVGKPGTIAVHGGAGEARATLIDLVAEAYEAPVDLHLVHRLDKGTSGIVAIAKSRDAKLEISRAWADAQKLYLAVVFGSLSGPRVLTDPVEHRGELRSAETRLVPIAALDRLEPAACLVRIELLTGRTHQIRQHFAEAGHPVAFDDQHGDFAKNRALHKSGKALGLSKKTLLLHAVSLELNHPRSGRRMRFTLSPPWAEAVLRASSALSSTPELISRSLG
ncbi:MAG: RluA family pseudouridine synthase [Deltaproteobacteria bacterium]|nr:RluA family pseudouridine synthase [Deltaproteobacteria bacterium]